MAEIGKRIKARRESLKMTQEQLASKLGYRSKTTIAKVENGTNDIPQSKVIAFAKALDTSVAYLMGWEEPPAISNVFPLPKTKKVPLLGTIACGTPILAVENVNEYVDMDSSLHADFALRCKGDSMINARVFDGDIVYIRQQPTVENGEIAAVMIGRTETEATLKRVFLDSEKIRLCAENPRYKDLVFFEEQMNEIRILGKAVAFLSNIQ